MKKSLLALAALSAIAGTAQAQSSVTLFGALDAGMYYANGVTNKGNSAYGVLGNTIVSSNWGLKGTEDLGGGTKANFYAESGIDPRNGALSQNMGQLYAPGAITTATLFDRGLYVGLQGNWGSLDIGNKINPLFASHAAITPVSGNSVSVNAAAALGFANSTFTHNSITYTMPTVAGFNGAIQYGAGNNTTTTSTNAPTVGGAIGGSVLAAAFDYTVGGLNVRAAGQKRWAGGNLLSANAYTGATSVASASNTVTFTGQTTWLLGAKYSTGPFTLGGGWASNQITAPLNGAYGALPTLNNNAFELGAGYQATPAVLLGLNWMAATSGSSLINAQARYAFSKRTQAYAQAGYALNKGGLNGLGLGNFYALSGSSGGGFSGVTPAAPTYDQFALGVGLIHTF